MTYEEDYQSTLPLGTIYALNCQKPGQTTQDFKTLLMEHLQQLPSQPCTLPANAYTKHILKCFPPVFEGVDFDQALKALDYMKALDMRRKKELTRAIKYRGDHDSKVITLQARSLKLDWLYAKALVGIRRWVSILPQIPALRVETNNLPDSDE